MHTQPLCISKVFADFRSYDFLWATVYPSNQNMLAGDCHLDKGIGTGLCVCGP